MKKIISLQPTKSVFFKACNDFKLNAEASAALFNDQIDGQLPEYLNESDVQALNTLLKMFIQNPDRFEPNMA
jgi:hypothetical protein